MLDGQENKMRTQIAISPGIQVKHERYGIGTVVKEWGSWLCCKVCLTPFEDEKRSRKCSVMLVGYWAEHLRQHARMTKAETELADRVWAMHAGDEEPIVRHYLEANRLSTPLGSSAW